MATEVLRLVVWITSTAHALKELSQIQCPYLHSTVLPLVRKIQHKIRFVPSSFNTLLSHILTFKTISEILFQKFCKSMKSTFGFLIGNLSLKIFDFFIFSWNIGPELWICFMWFIHHSGAILQMKAKLIIQLTIEANQETCFGLESVVR